MAKQKDPKSSGRFIRRGDLGYPFLVICSSASRCKKECLHKQKHQAANYEGTCRNRVCSDVSMCMLTHKMVSCKEVL